MSISKVRGWWADGRLPEGDMRGVRRILANWSERILMVGRPRAGYRLGHPTAGDEETGQRWRGRVSLNWLSRILVEAGRAKHRHRSLGWRRRREEGSKKPKQSGQSERVRGLSWRRTEQRVGYSLLTCSRCIKLVLSQADWEFTCRFLHTLVL